MDIHEARKLNTYPSIKQGRKPYLSRKVVDGLRLLYENSSLDSATTDQDIKLMSEAGRWIAGMLRYYDQKDKRKHEAQKPHQKDQGK